MIQERNLPAIFESFSQARKDGFVSMKTLKRQGHGVVGTFCTFVPVELITAADLIPVGLCSTSDETILEAEKTLPRNLCPLIKASYGFAVTDKCPYMYFADLVVGETTCDGKIKMYEQLGKIKNTHVMELPHSQHKAAARQLWLAEIMAFKERLEETFGVEIREEALYKAIAERNQERRLLKAFYGLSRLSPPPMTGLQQLQTLYGSQFRFNHAEKVRELEESIARITEAYQRGERPVSPQAKRILITGCPMGGATEKIVRLIEESGGVVVVYENCTGAKQFDRQVPPSDDPYGALADYYLAVGCSVMTPNPHRFELLDQLCAEFTPGGVIEMTLEACHTYAVETATVREFMKKRGTPFLSVETGYSPGDIEQLRTRIAAFIELLP
jgi:benzoyl-CoA reductase/2-hydroxyglutaryl-CoA dehydratase subunit BcrC/BadD/HgdB